MPASPRTYRTMEEFEREELRPSNRVGLSFEDIVDDATFDAELTIDELDFDDGRARR